MSAEPSGMASLYLFFSGLFGIGFAIGGLIALIWLIIVLINTNTYLKLLINDRKIGKIVRQPAKKENRLQIRRSKEESMSKRQKLSLFCNSDKRCIMDKSSSCKRSSGMGAKQQTRGFCGLYESVHDIIARKLLSDIEYYLNSNSNEPMGVRLMNKSINIQDTFLNQLRKENIPATVYLTNGFQIRGTIKAFDNFTIVIDSDGRQQMVYKHAISTFTPQRSVSLMQQDNSGEA